MDNESRAALAASFLEKLNTIEPEEFERLLQADLGAPAILALAECATDTAAQAVSPADFQAVAVNMILVGYLLARAEDRAAFQAAKTVSGLN